MAKKKPILLIDMDGVLANFIGAFKNNTSLYKHNPPEMYKPNFFKDLEPVKGSLESIRRLIQSNKFDIWICTQPVASSPLSYTEKAQWVWSWIPELGEKIIMTQNKNLVDCSYLIDDNKKWERGCKGQFLYFDLTQNSEIMWKKLTTQLLS